MARQTDPIKKVQLDDGTVRWRFVVDVGRRPDGGRDQRTFTYDTQKEARAERARIISERAKGIYVPPTKITVDEYLTQWLAGKRNLRAGTRRTYEDALKHVRARVGAEKLQDLNKAALDRLVEWMLKSGRRVGNKRTMALKPRTVNSTLTVLSQALESAVKQGIIGRNPVDLVERPAEVKKEMQTWTAEEANTFLHSTSEDRLYALWCLSLYGLRRGEIVGLRWSRIDLTGKRAEALGFPAGTPTITVYKTRVSVAGVVIEEDPKSERGNRTLPLDAELVSALKKFKARQAQEKLAAGQAYVDSGLLAVDELGQPYRPEWYGDRFQWLSKAAGLPVIRLHDTRHTCGTLMHMRHVPVAVISAWLGHANAAFTMRTYVHSQDQALVEASTTMAALLGRSKAM